MLAWFRKRAAEVRGIPYSYDDFWPPFYISFGGKAAGMVLRKIYEASPGNVVPVIRCDDETHFYKIISEGRASGDDHIVSPRQWNIVYHHSEPTPTEGADNG